MGEMKQPLTVKQLRERLAELPDDLSVCFDTEASCWGCHMVGVHSAYAEDVGGWKYVGLNCHDPHVPCRATPPATHIEGLGKLLEWVVARINVCHETLENSVEYTYRRVLRKIDECTICQSHPVGWWCEKCRRFQSRKTHIIEGKRVSRWCGCGPISIVPHQRKHWKRVYIKV